MEALLEQQPRVARAMRVQKRLKIHFPYKTYGARYIKRGTQEGIARYGNSWEDADPEQKKRRNEDGWYGPGLYTNTGYSGHGSGSGLSGSGAFKFRDLIGGVRAVGGLVGRPILNALQNRAIGMIGSGAYDSSPGILGSSSGNLELMNPQASINQLIDHANPSRTMTAYVDETNSITITHSEYIGDIQPTSSAFQTQYFISLNPGLAGTFPWLSNIAQFYEEYEFKQLAFSFKSMVTEGNSGASGTVIMASQYNPANPAFAGKQAMENYDYANSCKVTADAHHGVECDPGKRGGNQIEYIRTGAIPSNQDLKTYDHATFQLATTGAQANLLIGELWISYKCVLRKTKIPQVGQVGRLNSAFAGANLTGTINATSPLGTTTDVASANPSSGFTIQGNTITFPSYILSGQYMPIS